MAHQVLAREWRPRDFSTLVGQDHVVRALSHALRTGRLHHAYLFTGTRGVGKTTIARILAKALNCETGVTDSPCGRCRNCTDIDAGRFPDYLEMDAASNRGVDEMAQLLEAAVYAPSAGRYKVYVIDEVHMLSTHAFNAMLKTLEEPPGHVVFILATTDPQKVPVTVLSRCLQFGLRNMPPDTVAGHLAAVLRAEGVDHEMPALGLIGRAAAGSMRDALSLLDQAIAFGGGSVPAAAVREMLGAVDADWVVRLTDALVAADGPALLAVADDMAAAGAPWRRVLDEFAVWLHRLALCRAGVAPPDDDPDASALRRQAAAIAPEDLQVGYQILIHGARDLGLAPDERVGFTMTLLRLLAFRPQSAGAPPRPVAAPRPAPAAAQAVPPVRVASTPAPAPAPDAAALPVAAGLAFDGDWPALAGRVALSGFARQFLEQSELLGHRGTEFRVRVPIRPLAEAATVARVREALAAHFGSPVRLSVEVGQVAGATAAQVAETQRGQRLEEAREALEADPFVRGLLDEFDGRIVPDSIRPADA